MTNESSKPKKSLGQHWLNDEATLEAICAAAEVSVSDTVLEIGPGQGSLTEKLLTQASQVVAVELDDKLAESLEKKNLACLKIVRQDILRFDLTTLPAGYKVVANIPYYLTSNLIRVLSESANPPTVAVLLIQKEVAERVTAQPGAMSILSVTAQFYWQVSLGHVVPAELFEPPPKVDSQILILKRRIRPAFKDIDTKQFFRLAKTGFGQRRKTLENSLSAGLAISKPQARGLLESAGVMPTARAQTLSLDDWHKLYKAAENKKLTFNP